MTSSAGLVPFSETDDLSAVLSLTKLRLQNHQCSFHSKYIGFCSNRLACNPYLQSVEEPRLIQSHPESYHFIKISSTHSLSEGENIYSIWLLKFSIWSLKNCHCSSFMFIPSGLGLCCTENCTHGHIWWKIGLTNPVFPMPGGSMYLHWYLEDRISCYDTNSGLQNHQCSFHSKYIGFCSNRLACNPYLQSVEEPRLIQSHPESYHFIKISSTHSLSEGENIYSIWLLKFSIWSLKNCHCSSFMFIPSGLGLCCTENCTHGHIWWKIGLTNPVFPMPGGSMYLHWYLEDRISCYDTNSENIIKIRTQYFISSPILLFLVIYFFVSLNLLK